MTQIFSISLDFEQRSLIRQSNHLHKHYSQRYFVHRHPNNTQSLIRKPYLAIIANNVIWLSTLMLDFYSLLETIGKYLLPTGAIVNRFKMPLIVEPLLALIKKLAVQDSHLQFKIYSRKPPHNPLLRRVFRKFQAMRYFTYSCWLSFLTTIYDSPPVAVLLFH